MCGSKRYPGGKTKIVMIVWKKVGNPRGVGESYFQYYGYFFGTTTFILPEFHFRSELYISASYNLHFTNADIFHIFNFTDIFNHLKYMKQVVAREGLEKTATKKNLIHLPRKMEERDMREILKHQLDKER